VVPDLAERVPSLENGDARVVDGKLVVTWHIRADAAWEDGKPVVADDFILGWRVQSDTTQEIVVGRDDAQRIDAMIATPGNPREFTVTWREPNPFFAQPRVHRPLPAHVISERTRQPGWKLHTDPIARAPLSNGPFKLKEHAPGQHFWFVRNDAYAPRAQVDEVLVKIAPSTSTALTMLAAQQADLVFPSGGPSPVEARTFASTNAGATVTQAAGQVWTHVDFNLDDPWLADVRVRRALAHALPRDEIFRELSGGLYETAHTYLPPKHWGHASAIAPLAFDKALATRLLDEAGWTLPTDAKVRVNARGESLRLELAAASEVTETAALLQHCVQAWRDVGVDVVLDLRPFKVFFGEGARKRKLKHMSFYSWTLDGTSMGGSLWRADKIPSPENGFKGSNLPGWKNDEVTRLLQEADATLDLASRRAQLARVQALYREELPAIPMYFRPVVVVHATAVRGIAPTGTLTPLAWNAHLWRRSRR
jgi:peptide/nickel transport system substrate-binding protein